MSLQLNKNIIIGPIVIGFLCSFLCGCASEPWDASGYCKICKGTGYAPQPPPSFIENDDYPGWYPGYGQKPPRPFAEAYSKHDACPRCGGKGVREPGK